MKRGIKKGFTLIELLTVISIIGIMAGMLLPTLATVREKARKASCISNLKAIGTAAQIYSDDNGGKWPVSNAPSGNGVWTSSTMEYINLGMMLANSQNNGKMLYCPSATKFTYDDPSTGYQNFGTALGATAISYWMRGPPHGMPLSQDGQRKAMVADIYSTNPFLFKSHSVGANVLYTDNSVKFVNLDLLDSVTTSNTWAKLDSN
jgi:prepilin-type N-terminal cleavage/methylation domain-containing protein